ncbi:MAG: phosphoenolpyruvate-utilizing N-terminal domain-containing protein, partial [Oscillospiraceae bacterium]
MVKYKGKGVYGAVAIGKISVFKRRDIEVKRRKTDDPSAEIARLEAAKETAKTALRGIYEKALREVGEANAEIFEIHIMMIDDEDYNDAITEMITNQRVNAEYAVAVTGDNFAAMFSAMDDAYMQARSADVRDISNRIISCLGGGESEAASCGEKVII